MPPRKLTREGVIAAAISLADEQGIDHLSMRGLARHLGVEAMSLYHHLADKAVLLDAMVDSVFAEVELPAADGDWRAGLPVRPTWPITTPISPACGRLASRPPRWPSRMPR